MKEALFRKRFLTVLAIFVILSASIPTSFARLAPPPQLLEIADFNQDGRIDDVDKACHDSIVGGGTIAESCLAVYGFGCHGVGDLAKEVGELDKLDILIESWIVRDRVSDIACAEVNDDGIIDEDDLVCLTAIVNEDHSKIEEFCTPCQVRMMELGAYSQYEICFDGLDNNCDDLVDKTSEDPEKDDCLCRWETPCSSIKKDNDGVPGIDDGDYSVCRTLSWEGEEPQWIHVDYANQLASSESCELDKNCEWWACEGSAYVCTKFGEETGWLEVGEPKEPGAGEKCETVKYKCKKYTLYYGPYGGKLPCEGKTAKKLRDISLCDDGWDNNCDGLDYECKSNPDCETCFPAGTPITMADGSVKNIEDVEVGDMVLSCDISSGEQVSVEVLELDSPVRDHLYTLIFESGETLRLTSEHPLYAKGKGWVSIDPEATYGENRMVVSELEMGDSILNVEDDWVTVTDMTYEEMPEGIQTYNLKTINGYNTFFAGGFLAHNKNWFKKWWDLVVTLWQFMWNFFRAGIKAIKAIVTLDWSEYTDGVKVFLKSVVNVDDYFLALFGKKPHYSSPKAKEAK